MKKVGRQIILDKWDNFKVNYGTVNVGDTKSIYINIMGWGLPKLDIDNYSLILKEIRKNIKREVYFNFNDNFNKSQFLTSFDMRESGFSKTKPSYMHTEITLYQTSNLRITDEDIVMEVEGIVSMVIENVLEDNKYFKFASKKLTIK